MFFNFLMYVYDWPEQVYCYSLTQKIDMLLPAFIDVPSLQMANRRPPEHDSLPALVVKNGNEGYYFDMKGRQSHRFLFEGSVFDVKGVPGVYFADFEKGESCLVFYASIFTYQQQAAEHGLASVGQNLHECSLLLVPKQLAESDVSLFCRRMNDNITKCQHTSVVVLVDCNNKPTVYRSRDLSVILKNVD